MVFSYKQSYEKTIADDLKVIYQTEIETLEEQAFDLFSVHQETIWPLSVIYFFPIYLMMAANEYVRIGPSLRIKSYHLLYHSKPGATFAYIYGMGCKFYTKFTDGTWIVSNTKASARDERIITVRHDSEMVTTEQVLEIHQEKIQEKLAEGRQLANHLTFEDWVDVENRFDQNNLLSLIVIGIIWMAFLGLAIYWLVRIGLSLTEAIS